MTTKSDISFEIFHFYLNEIASEIELEKKIQIASDWAFPLISNWEKQGLKVSTCILIDDISGFDVKLNISSKIKNVTEKIEKEFSQRGINVDYIFAESLLNDSASWIASHLTPIPKVGDGAFENTPMESLPKNFQRYLVLNNSEEDSSEIARYRDDPIKGTRGLDIRRSIGLSTPIYRRNSSDELDKMIFSCPTLASWWQLIRLGILSDNEVQKYLGKEILSVSKMGQLPSTNNVKKNPFYANMTVSLLDPKYMAVEHAVRSILNLIDYPESFLRSVAKSQNIDEFSLVEDRIGYIFAIPFTAAKKSKRN